MVSQTETGSGRPYSPAQVRRLTDFDLTLPALGLLILFFVLPVAMLLTRSVTEPVPGLGNYAELLGSSTYLRIFANTFIVSGLVTFVSLLIGFPVAWALAIMPSRAASIVFAILLLSMWTNLLARTYAWMVLLQRTGSSTRCCLEWGSRYAASARQQPDGSDDRHDLHHVALHHPAALWRHPEDRSCHPAGGCSLWRQSLAVARARAAALAMPGMAAGALMVFVMSLGYFVTPALLGGTSNMMLAELIAQFVQSLVNWGMGGAAALVLLVVTLALYAVQLRFFGTNRMGGR